MKTQLRAREENESYHLGNDSLEIKISGHSSSLEYLVSFFFALMYDGAVEGSAQEQSQYTDLHGNMVKSPKVG